jgi:arabinose-5-phosphate isomerase
MGDAIAVSLLELRGFSTNDFAKVHPGGALGKMLYLTAADIYTHNEKPQVKTDTPMAEVIVEMTSKRLGATAVLEDHKIAGMITDGDLRRMIQREQNYTHLKAGDIMNKHPKTISHDTLLVDALHMMRGNNITQVLVTQNDQYVGVIHIHDILKEGII